MDMLHVLMKPNICLFIKDEELLETYNKIWDRVSNLMKKGFDSETLYNEKYLKTKLKSYNSKKVFRYFYIKVFILLKFCVMILIILSTCILLFVYIFNKHYNSIHHILA